MGGELRQLSRAPAAAFGEIARTLAPGGVHLFTVPWNPDHDTVVRAVREGSEVRHLAPPVYHRDPTNPRGVLVATDWGRDLFEFIRAHGGMETRASDEHDPQRGIEGGRMRVLVSRKLG